MILESVQMMCTALNKRDFTTPYRSTHPRHPCVLWVERSYDNFLWLGQLAEALNSEFRLRYQKDSDHASLAVLKEIIGYRFESKGLTEFAQAMPDQYKVPGDAVTAYRNFYLAEKSVFARWKFRPAPDWWTADAN
jgi:hypothetical protein